MCSISRFIFVHIRYICTLREIMKCVFCNFFFNASLSVNFTVFCRLVPKLCDQSGYNLDLLRQSPIASWARTDTFNLKKKLMK